MKHLLHSLVRARRLLLAALLGLLPLSVSAQPKLAVVNLTNLFDGYWKTKEADIQLKDRASDFDKVRKGLVDDDNKAKDDYRKLSESANDQAVAQEERDRRKKSAESKLVEIRDIEQSLTQLDQNARTQLGDHRARLQNGILREIRDAITAKSKASGYTLVIDSSALSAVGTPLVLYNTGTPDITEEVLQYLPQRPGAAAPSTPAKADDKKDKDKK